VYTTNNAGVALGHVRLSINDLSPDGAQPFHSPNGRIHAVVNGEFYDYDCIRKELEDTTGYVFRSRSDSEIVIALYMHHGLNFVHYLRGEFAVVLFDEDAQYFVAVRDRYGIKPLFWTIQQDPDTLERKLLIAAEMKAFLPLGWTPEWDVRSLKDAGWNHDERTIFKGVQKVRPGHYISCTGFGHVEQRQYWDADYADKRIVDQRTPDEIVEGVRERMLEAIRLRLRADVPIGIYLSGGIDSSVIAGMVTHLVKEQGIAMGSAPPNERVCCFSIAFDEESGFDESSIANRTADWLGVKYQKKHMSEAELARRFEDATWHTEHHNPDLNFVGKFALSEVPLEAGYKVVLTGEGADEHFAGYPLFLPDYLRETDAAWAKYNALPESEREAQLNLAEDAAKAYYDSVGADTSLRGPSVSRQMLNNITTISSMVAFQPDVFATWTDTAFGATDAQRTIANNIDGRVRQKILESWHPLHSAEYVWSKGHLANIFLTCLGDRTEMAHSIEARTPLLDHHLTDYVNRLPPSSKLRWVPATEEFPEGRFVEKWVLREAAKPFITRELYERKKHPYSAPTTWPRDGPLHELLAGLLTKENVNKLGFVEWDKVKGLVDHGFGENGDPGAMRKALVVTEWVVLSKRFGVRRAAPTV
jgi:asparagine synthase (glutamine-hydrolysing)